MIASLPARRPAPTPRDCAWHSLGEDYVGQFVAVDVTPLMIQAQQRGLVDFQVRIMEDLGPASFTLVVIDDPVTVDRPQRAPLLTVTYH